MLNLALNPKFCQTAVIGFHVLSVHSILVVFIGFKNKKLTLSALFFREAGQACYRKER
jgi:hypothetical protein